MCSSADPTPHARRLPLPLKWGCTLFAVATFSAYLAYYSFPASLMWFSSIALVLTCVGLWLESRLVISMQAVGVLVLEFGYTVDFVVRVATGHHPIGLSVHFFDAEASPWWVRAFSLFHLPLPWLLLWLLSRLGYDGRGWRLQTGLAWLLLPTCYLFTDPADNVNWVFGPDDDEWPLLAGWRWVALQMAILPLAVYLPTHAVLKRVFGTARDDASAQRR
jgi:hypothetical protein